jgi:hypothetical protein
MKKVVNNETVAHLWANEQQAEANSPNRSFYFCYDTIFSYGSHFPIAKHITNNKGEKGILFTTRSYSNTTAKHISDTLHAIPYKESIIYCINPNFNPSENLSKWDLDITAIFLKLAKAKKPEKYLTELSYLNYQIKKYCSFMGVDIPEAIKVKLEITTKAESIEAANKANEIKAANEAKKAKEQEAENKKQLKKFRNFERYSFWDGYAYLRYNKETNRIETSQRIEIPVEAAKRLYHTIKQGLKDRILNNPKTANLKILDYWVKNVQTDFIEVGCHRIEMKEINRIAKSLNF